MIVGVDIGTSTISIVLCEVDETPVRVWNTPNDSGIRGMLGQSLQNPDRIVDQTIAILDVISTQYKIDRIGITSQMHGVLYIDSQGRAVSPLYTWEDESGLKCDASGVSFLDSLNAAAKTNLVKGIAYGGLTHYFLTKTDAIPDKAVCFCGIGDYLSMRLTHGKTPMEHVSMAASFGLYSLEKRSYDHYAIEKSGMDAGYFPQIQLGDAVYGETREGIRVTVSIGDNQASFLGSVNDRERDILLNLGTGGQISCFSNEIIEVDGIETRPLLDDSYIAVYTSHCGGRAYAALEKFFREVLGMAGIDTDSLYAQMNAAVLSYQGRDVVSVDPAFCGSRAKPCGKASISDLSLDNFTPSALTYGFMRGICEELYPFYDRMRKSRAFERIIGSGNTIRKNSAMRHVVEDVFEVPLMLTASTEEAAMGAIWFANNAEASCKTKVPT